MAFTFGATNSKIKVAPPQIRVVKVAPPKKQAPLPSRERLTSRPASQDTSRNSSLNRKPKPKPKAHSSPETPERRLAVPVKRKAARQASPAQNIFDSDSEDEEEEDSRSTPVFDPEKRRKADLTRKIRSRQVFFDKDEGDFEMIHAADLGSSGKKVQLASNAKSETVTVDFQYPSASQRERYNLVFGKDQLNPAEEIFHIADIVSRYYLTPKQFDDFIDQDTGLVRKIERARNLLLKNVRDKYLLNNFKDAVVAYSTKLEDLIKDGGIGLTLNESYELPFDLVRCLLAQVYDRVVSPRVDFLRRKTENKDNTYGELHDKFVTKIIDETNLKSDHVFVDLGSGVGNVVLQAALEAGCESWGCEMMETAGAVAAAQKKEFQARCRLWGIEPGPVHLERGDFRENKPIMEAIKRADVILVNNEVFGPELNESLKLMFLDVKHGCKVVSLKSFGPADNKSRNENDSFKQFRVKQMEYYENYVSWKGDRGTYFIATKDSKVSIGASRRHT